MVNYLPIKSIKVSLKLRFFVTLIVLIMLSLHCNNSGDRGSSQGDNNSLPRNKTLYVGGFQWGQPQSFNPISISPSWPMTGNINLVYEALFGYNLLDGKLKGILGKSYSLSGNVIKIELQPMARWQNGDSLTSDDVVYTFLFHKNYSTIFSYVWNYIDDVKKINSKELQIILNEKELNSLVVLDVIAALPILPKKIFQKIEKDAFAEVSMETGAAPSNSDIIEKIREFKNDSNPIGSGPYTLKSYSDKKIVLQRVDNYWGNVLYNGTAPRPLYIVHPLLSDNNEMNNSLRKGELDISQTFFPRIWDHFSSGVGTWYSKEPYYVPGIIPTLMMGLTKEPFSDRNFRIAVAHCIDYEKIRSKAVYGYSLELQPGLILPFGPEKEFFSQSDVQSFGKLYDPQQARKVLKDAGYSWGTDSMLVDPKGKKVRTLYVTCPSGWTDWEQTVRIAVEGMRAIGIDVHEKFLDYGEWDNNLKRGLFDFTMKTPQPEQAASLPWSRFERIMSTKEFRPVGEFMYSNEGRFKNPTADKLLILAAQTTNHEEMKALYGQLNRLFMDEMPVIPLMYRPWLFYQFSTKHWNNFPTDKNPYAAPQCLMVGAGISALWGIASK